MLEQPHSAAARGDEKLSPSKTCVFPLSGSTVSSKAMTLEIGLVFAILTISLVLFVTEKVPMDVTALLVLCALAISGLVSPTDALSGFSNAAVITVWAMFILSEGLTRTGVADLIGRHVLKAAGAGETRLVIVVMTVAGVLSAFMNNIGVAALMLPVVLDVARKTGSAPSRLLMPLAYGTLLGGLTTLIGTPPNLLVSNALKANGLESFGLFDFTPIGSIAMGIGILFVAFAGRHLLPQTDPGKQALGAVDPVSLHRQYALEDRVFVMRVPLDSLLAGVTLGESRLGSALRLNVLAIIRDGKTIAAPSTPTVINPDDRLIVQGRLDELNKLRGWKEFSDEVTEGDPERVIGEGVGLGQLRIAPDSILVGKTLGQADFRNRFGAVVLRIRRADPEIRAELPKAVLSPGDRLLVQGTFEVLQMLAENPAFDAYEAGGEADTSRLEELREKIFEVIVPEGSVLADRSLEECRLGDAFGLRVLGIVRHGKRHLLPDPDETLAIGDRLIIHGLRQDLRILRGLQGLEIDSETAPDLAFLDSGEIGLMEATLAPRSTLAGTSLRDLHFRERYGLQILAIWRNGRTVRSNLREMTLEQGDAFLIMGQSSRMELLRTEKDYLLLTKADIETFRTTRAPVAGLIMLGVLLPVLFGWLPIAISAICGSVLMVLFGCLKMEEAYEAIEWRAVFLIAGMIPLGVAMQDSGAASLIANGVVGLLGDFGPWPVIMGLYAVTAVATTIVPTAALVLLMAPIVIQSCNDLGVSPLTGMMAIAMAASASFTSPISHPANILVMGPGGYRFKDYIKMGIPLALVIFAVVMVVLPILWPLYP